MLLLDFNYCSRIINERDVQNVTSTYAFALVQTDVHGAFELNVGGFWKFESSKFGRQKVPIDGVEVLKKVRVH